MSVCVWPVAGRKTSTLPADTMSNLQTRANESTKLQFNISQCARQGHWCSHISAIVTRRGNTATSQLRWTHKVSRFILKTPVTTCLLGLYDQLSASLGWKTGCLIWTAAEEGGGDMSVDGNVFKIAFFSSAWIMPLTLAPAVLQENLLLLLHSISPLQRRRLWPDQTRQSRKGSAKAIISRKRIMQVIYKLEIQDERRQRQHIFKALNQSIALTKIGLAG